MNVKQDIEERALFQAEEIQRLQNIADKYNELIMAVGNKYPGESRHETALRYIVERESQPCSKASNDIKEN